MSIMEKFTAKLFGSQNDKTIKQMLPELKKINLLEEKYRKAKNSDFKNFTQDFKNRLENGESLDNLLPEAFAVVREAARRKLGERHYDVQLLGGIILHQGNITEMKTGEGKTLSSVTAAYLNSLTGKGVHIVTVNNYLAERDANWMKKVYDLLDVSVGVVLPNMSFEEKQEAYKKDITYGTNNEFGFDYLRDNMAQSLKHKVQRGHSYCIIDEIDSILIDEARTPLIISGPADDDTAMVNAVNPIVRMLKECSKDPETDEYPLEDADLDGDYKLDEKNKRVTFTEKGMLNIEKILIDKKLIKDSLFNQNNFEFIHYITQAVKAHKLFKKDVDYVVQNGKVEIVDEFTGRVLVGRRYSDGLHQAIESKEKIRIAKRNKTLATITFQNYFRLYDKISGMTGTAETEAKEFANIYNLGVVVVPTNRPVSRKDKNDQIYFSEDYKIQAICDEIKARKDKGQPVLVGTVSIEKSELISKYLKKRGIKHEVLNAKNHEREAHIIAEAGAKGSVTIATNMAGRGTDIKLGGNPEHRARKIAGPDATPEEFQKILNQEYINSKKNYQEILELGGLYILGTERHESRRIDNQLRGRSGRQGDSGESRFFLSMDDDLMRLFGGENLKSMIGRLGMVDGSPIEHRMISNAIEKAQNKVEERNYEIRKHLLEFDDVLNEQRKFIYQQRDNILKDKNLIERILNTIEEMVEDYIEDFYRATTTKDIASVQLLNFLQEDFNLNSELFSNIDFNNITKDELFENIMSKIKYNLKEKEDKISTEELNRLIRHFYLTKIDNSWQQHLEELEALREAVNLRAYAQKNPLLEYKLEGFKIFDNLILNIKEEIAKNMIKIEIKLQGEDNQTYRSPLRNSFTNMNLNTNQDSSQIQSKSNKVGRNSPCPCGSGKKYKKCCGA